VSWRLTGGQIVAVWVLAELVVLLVVLRIVGVL
jgi:hypothetical protein